MTLLRQRTSLIVIHCSATPAGRDVTAAEIDTWHKQRGFNKIGYHYVIRLDGSIEAGREVDEVGAHAKGFNTVSVGICLVGGVDANNIKQAEDTFTPAQYRTLERLVGDMLRKYPNARVCGHRDLDPGKACPSFNVAKWMKPRFPADAIF